jgi:hypothetical protein
MFGCGYLDSKRTDANTNEVMRKRDPACDSGISPGDEG